jgi:hypothetical protein
MEVGLRRPFGSSVEVCIRIRVATRAAVTFRARRDLATSEGMPDVAERSS